MTVQQWESAKPGKILYEAVLFDMDGVVTDTASVHARAWKALFDEVLGQLSPEPVAPFDMDADYKQYVDGRSREDGIRAFLAARGIELPEGGEGASAAEPTITGLAARKQRFFDEQLKKNGVTAFPGTVALLHKLRGEGIKTALVTSSRNGQKVLTAAGIEDLFDTRVDGTTALESGLVGKPDPAMFLEAARRLDVSPDKAVVVEDAEAGVVAGVRGGFGLVVGVDPSGGGHLLESGAHLVLADLDTLDLAAAGHRQNQWGGGIAGSADPWLLAYDDFDPEAEGIREALCTLGNGYWGTRGAAPEAVADALHYPGTYLAGVYNRLRTDLGSRSSMDEHLVNAPNWLPLWFKTADGGWFHPGDPQILDYRQELDLRRGVLERVVRYRDAAGRTTRIISRRFVSQAAHHVAALVTTFEAEDWSGPLTVRSALDGQVANRNVAAYRLLADTHLSPVLRDEIDAETVQLDMVTNQSGIHISMVARTRVFRDHEPVEIARRLIPDEAASVGHEFELNLAEGRPVTVEKVVVVASSRDRAVSTPAAATATWIRRLPDAGTLQEAHERAWARLWDAFGVETKTYGHQSLALNLNTFHVLQAAAAADPDLDAGLAARGLHGEGYRGHVFWDELFVYPMLTLRRPELTRALLGYRYRRLSEARAAARAEGFEGARFPWQSGSDGREETPTELYNTRNEQWMPDNSRIQRHVGLEIAYSVWEYYQGTGDRAYLIDQGAELLLEVARYFAGLATYDADTDRYDIAGVMGPDEFHDGYPGCPGHGLSNNAYTNVMSAWVLERALETVQLLEGDYCGPLWGRLGIRPDELKRWRHISRRLRVLFHPDGVISQFEGYEQLAEFSWDDYRERYGEIGRLDLILQAEGDSTNNYRLSKQADVLMLLYLFSAEELRALLGRMGYELSPEAVRRTVKFYSSRTSYGSTLSHVVHSWVDARRDRYRSWYFLTQALDSDLADIQGGTTREGIHLGAMAGSVDMVIRCYTGLEIRDDMLWLHPAFPPELPEVAFNINYRGQPVRLEITADNLRLRLDDCMAAPIRVKVEGREASLDPGEVRDFPLR